MKTLLHFLGANPYILLFLIVGLAVWIGRLSIKGYELGMVAAAIVVGCGVSVLGSTYGETFHLNDFTEFLFYYLFMYGVGLRVGPSFVNSLKDDGLKYGVLAVISCALGLAIAVIGTKMFDLPVGAAGGILAGSQTMSTAIGSAEQAVTSGVVQVPPGSSNEQVFAMIVLAYGITYIWGTVGIILICKYLPRWWGVDAKKAAAEYEKEHEVSNVEAAGLSGYRPFGLRAYRLESVNTIGETIEEFRAENPEYRVVNVLRGGRSCGAAAKLALEKGDVMAIGGTLIALTDKMGLIGPEVSDPQALDIPLDQAEILVTNKEYVDKPLISFRNTELAGQLQLTRIERGGVPIPLSTDIKLRRMDVLFVVGLKDAVAKAGSMLGRIARPSTATDLLTLAFGMVFGFLIGLIQFPVFGATVGLGNAGGLLVSGILVSSSVSRLRFFGNTPNAARNILEDLGLVVFVAIASVNAGTGSLPPLPGSLALKIFLIGFVACTIPPFVVWTVGYHMFKINPAALMGGIAGARSHSGPAREAAKETDSSVPWLGFPVGYAVSGVLLTVFGYFAMVLAK